MLILLLALPGTALADSTVDTRPNIAPDIREDATVKLQRGDFVAVPIPLSNPTLGSGLIGGGAYFYPQTESQKNSQPASVTAAAAMYTDNESKAIGVLQQNYWRDDKWRFTGIALSADIRLELNLGNGAESSSRVDWRVLGSAAFDYLGDRSVAGQVELRWRVWQRFGLAAFGGTGWISNAPYADGRDDRIDSAGVGLRFEVLPAKRLNLRLDFAWSEDDQAVYLAVGEAF